MQMTDLDFDLPPELIATHPAHPRDHSRLMVVRPDSVEHLHFFDLPDLLTPGDLLIVNDTRVLPARLLLKKTTGAAIPGLFLSELSPGRWQVMLRSRGKLSAGDTLLTDSPDIILKIAARLPDRGHWLIDITPALPAADLLAKIGHVPLPPYIEKARQKESVGCHGSAQFADPYVEANENLESADRLEYQTVYARTPGSLAAPTAGLHFTPELLSRLDSRNITRAPVTLEVGLGTFLPVEAPTLEQHKMHAESYHILATTIAALRHQRATQNRIVVVGTTAARTLESAAPKILSLSELSDIHASTTLCISPGYAFQLTDILITNFHLPKSTLLALVAAKVGLARMQKLYAAAIQEKYRFYSYGDAMIILP